MRDRGGGPLPHPPAHGPRLHGKAPLPNTRPSIEASRGPVTPPHSLGLRAPTRASERSIHFCPPPPRPRSCPRASLPISRLQPPTSAEHRMGRCFSQNPQRCARRRWRLTVWDVSASRGGGGGGMARSWHSDAHGGRTAGGVAPSPDPQRVQCHPLPVHMRCGCTRTSSVGHPPLSLACQQRPPCQPPASTRQPSPVHWNAVTGTSGRWPTRSAASALGPWGRGGPDGGTGRTGHRGGGGGSAIEPVGRDPRSAMHWKEGRCPLPPPSRAPSLCPATVPLTPSASLNGICNRQ